MKNITKITVRYLHECNYLEKLRSPIVSEYNNNVNIKNVIKRLGTKQRFKKARLSSYIIYFNI